jgi:hypothetical protein
MTFSGSVHNYRLGIEDTRIFFGQSASRHVFTWFWPIVSTTYEHYAEPSREKFLTFFPKKDMARSVAAHKLCASLALKQNTINDDSPFV